MTKVAYYIIIEKEDNLFLRLYDENKKIICDFDCLEENNLNNYIADISSDDFNISWDSEKDNCEDIALDDDELIGLLVENNNIYNENFKKIQLIKENNKLCLFINDDEKNDDLLSINITINDIYSKYTALGNDYVYDGTKLFAVDVIKNHFFDLDSLIASIDKTDIERYLTLVINNYKNIDIRYKDYDLVNKKQEDVTFQLIIEKIDLDNSLHLSINGILSTLDYKFLMDNGVKNVVTVDEISKHISISSFSEDMLNEKIDYINKILANLQKQLGLKSSYYISENYIVISENIAKEFVIKELISLTSKFYIIGTDKLKKYNVKTVKPKISGNISFGIDYLEGEAEIILDGEKFSLKSILDSYKRDAYIVLSDGSNALIDKKYINKLERVYRDADKKNIKISFFDMPIFEELLDDKIVTKNFSQIKSFYEDLNCISNDNVNISSLKADLREYQKYGFNWLKYLINNKFGACLADDMGLGKTLQAIALISDLKAEIKKTLIIMPKSLIYNWDSEFKKFAPKTKVTIYYGPKRDLKILKNNGVILTTYGTIRNDIEILKDIDFDLIILDESQNIKNINSLTSKSVSILNSKYRVALSGTPIENNLNELYSLFRFLNPNMFGSYENFRKSYLVPIQKFRDSYVVEELKKKIYPFILRRIKKEVLKELPEKIEKILYVEMSPSHKKLYEEKRKYYYDLLNKNILNVEESKFYILQAINDLRHITSCPDIENAKIISSKQEILIENIIEAVENNHKVLVFTNYVTSLKNISKTLEKNGIKHLSMTGETKNRQELVNKFQNDERYKVFVMTLKTGGVGLNLTAADTIFIYDPWWNKTVENQAIDRAYRLGQDRTVFAYKMIVKGSIEEKILNLQKEKVKLLDSIIEEDNLTMKSLSSTDIEFLLGT